MLLLPGIAQDAFLVHQAHENADTDRRKPEYELRTLEGVEGAVVNLAGAHHPIINQPVQLPLYQVAETLYEIVACC